MNKSATIEKGERIGQLVLNKVEQINWNSVLVLSDTDRGNWWIWFNGKIKIWRI
jgi:dUTPase